MSIDMTTLITTYLSVLSRAQLWG